VTGRAIRIGAAVAVAGVLAAIGAAAPAAGASIVYFQTPSKNIGCAYLPAISSGDVPTLRCEIRSGLRPLPARRGRCREGVWGQAVAMTRRGRAGGICISDTVREPSAPVLGYGRTRRVGGFTCMSREGGLSCTNLSDHGWFLSRERSVIS
jgi:hypothetical protein